MNRELLIVDHSDPDRIIELASLLQLQEGLIIVDKKRQAEEEVMKIKRIAFDDPPFIYKKEDERVRREKLMRNFGKNRKKR